MSRLIKFISLMPYIKPFRNNFSCRWNIGSNTYNHQQKKSISIRNSYRNCDVQFVNKTSPNRDKLVGKWLLVCGGMVFVAVVLGGVTRLTESGLSMVTWKLMGEKIPRTEEDWREEFSKYQQYPEFKMKNSNMSLEEFKFIFWMEYMHRMWGRAIGAVFFIPATYFWRKGYFNKSTKIRITVMGTLIMAQGLMGWYMVKSGLENRFDNINDVPRVSQYRLAFHLTLAFLLYIQFIGQGLAKIMPPATPLQIYQMCNTKDMNELVKVASRFSRLAHGVRGFVFLTAISGAFVAGLDAGLVYNSFPKMGDKWIPDDVWALEPKEKNFTENPVTVQLNHRLLGITTLSLVTSLWLYSRRIQLTKRSCYAINAAVLAAWLQVTLGISTIVNYVPIPLAAAHQSGSLLLLTLITWLTNELRWFKHIPK